MTAPVLPLVRTCPYAPHAEHVRLREEAPITRVTMPNGQQAWAVSRFADVRAVLADPRFSTDRQRPGHPHFNPDLPRVEGRRPALLDMDPAEHAPARRAVTGEFTVRRMTALRPRIQQVTDEHVDALLVGPRPVDLVQALALPLPSLIICDLLGVPYADHEFFQRATETTLRRTAAPAQRMKAASELHDYLRDLVAAKAATPGGDDLIGRQLRRGAEAGDVVSLAFLLLIAGHETTANMISLGVFTLLQRPDQLAALRADPGRTPQAVEELLRYLTIAELVMCRVALADVEIGGVLIRAGEGVVMLANAANRDPAAFPDGEALELGRAARHHLSFGFGAHQCLGQHLARLELQIVFDTLFRRVPGLRLAVPADEVPVKDDGTVYGLHELPVTW
ncbi:cytochrome P450 [Micromonospora sp. WMMD882]|uniref:cytochrome P450 n=1 Tax=Micromonospora sp. WMMD882 TaxID=3015151 RepID=UPI00248C61A7|nr:cytochrome P450 [Micromonospora sp. WMMD882]WBB80575.1 cytochrome P450 [Micromonospora sp. WMMD882]